jgi:hypothetical protein
MTPARAANKRSLRRSGDDPTNQEQRDEFLRRAEEADAAVWTLVRLWDDHLLFSVLNRRAGGRAAVACRANRGMHFAFPHPRDSKPMSQLDPRPMALRGGLGQCMNSLHRLDIRKSCNRLQAVMFQNVSLLCG